MSPAAEVLIPQWGAPRNVRAAFTLRQGGVSTGPFQSLNLGDHVGDEPAAVLENRRRLGSALQLPCEPLWLRQVHGAAVWDAAQRPGGSAPEADAVVVRAPGRVAVVQVADCLPVLFSARDGAVVAAAHAGWRGLAAGVLEATVAAMAVDPRSMVAWLGPAIGPEAFEVGAEVREALLAGDPAAGGAFTPNARGRWQCDLVGLARRRLAGLAVGQVFGGSWCTYSEPRRFFSHRREGRCGRMAALLWMQ
ncbi:MAG: peptidoglycan editing factor PgeF [Proteobacteria bacterium]|nr:peptidoglycan editing factor PgeF [Pseudomonadota bacterium]